MYIEFFFYNSWTSSVANNFSSMKIHENNFAIALPEPPSNCEIEDEFLRCDPGHDGGLPQRFILEALEVRHHDPVMGDESTMNDQVRCWCC